jgi:hypothetical protein
MRRLEGILAIGCAWMCACTFASHELTDIDGGTGRGPDGAIPDGGGGTPDCNNMQVELLQNGNFDVTPNTAWTELPFAPKPAIIVTAQQLTDQGIAGIAPQGGNYLAWLGNVANSSEYLSQSVDVPADAIALHLLGYYQIATAEVMNMPYDHLVLELSNNTGTTNVIQDWTNQNATAFGWTQFDFTISNPASYVGQTWTLTIHSTLDDLYATEFYLDTLHLRARVCR